MRAKYPAIRAIIATECEDGTGLDELRLTIERETDRLEGLRGSFPAAWFKIKDELASMKQNYVTYDAYCDKCVKLGESDPTAQKDLAGYLHRLGIALNYQDDPRLRDHHVLNPHWVTNGIYTILNAELLRKRTGVLDLADLTHLLDRTEYPSGMHRFLIDLMKKFDLCFSFPGDDIRYLIPELLDKHEPAEAAQFNDGEALNFRYDYPILPEGLLPRFIVRTHGMSTELPRWRTGVVLAFESCRALIKADPQEKRVNVAVAGPGSRRRLLAVLRAEFERIHKDIKDLDPIEMVPLPSHPGSAVPYKSLCVREKNGKLGFDMVVNDEVVDLNARELLEGVELAGSRKKGKVMPERQRPVTVFYSYSHKDELLRDELATHLKFFNARISSIPGMIA